MKDVFYGIVAIVSSFALWHVIYAWLGLLLMKLGVKKLGHYCMAMSLAPHPVRNTDLVEKCPYNQENCDKCGLWTCPNYRMDRRPKK